MELFIFFLGFALGCWMMWGSGDESMREERDTARADLLTYRKQHEGQDAGTIPANHAPRSVPYEQPQ